MGSGGKSWLLRSGRQSSRAQCPQASHPADVGGRRGKKNPGGFTVSFRIWGRCVCTGALGRDRRLCCSACSERTSTRDALQTQAVNPAAANTLHRMASSGLCPWEKADTKSEWKKLLERAQTKCVGITTCRKQHGALLEMGWDSPYCYSHRVPLAPLGLGASAGAAVQQCKDQQAWGMQG